MNIRDIALNPIVIQENNNSLFGAMIALYLSFTQEVELDECMISYIYACS